MDESSYFRPCWNAIVGAAATASAIAFPLFLAIALNSNTTPHLPSWIPAATTGITLIYIADIAVGFSTPFIYRGRWIQHPAEIRKIYLNSWFTLDLIAALPLGLIATLFDAPLDTVLLLSSLRLIKLCKLPHYKNQFEFYLNINFSVLRLGFFLYSMSITAHWFACAWYTLTVDPSRGSIAQNYIDSLYWCVTTLTTVGYGDITPTTSIEKVFTMAVMILGVGAYGYIIGNIATLLSNLDRAKTRHHQRVESICSFMSANHFPTELQQRVKKHFDYLWAAQRGRDQKTVFGELPEKFHVDFALELNKELLHKVPMFDGAHDDFIEDIALALKPEIVLPNDRVCSFGEIGDKMYFVNKGSLKAYSEDEQTLYGNLEAGSFFGEIALLMCTPRTAHIIASDYCELYSLDKNSFDTVLSKYPEFERSVRARAKENLEGQEKH